MEIPRINPKSGLSVEYREALGPVTNFIKRVEGNEAPRTVLLAKNALRRQPIKKYGDYFGQEYEGVINESNRSAVSRLDELVAEINAYVPQMNPLPGNDSKNECVVLKGLIEKIDTLIQYGLK